MSVLPEPVGEATSTLLPAAMWGQAADCGGVGPAGKRRENQLATAGWKSDSGPVDSGRASGTLLFHQEVVTPTTAPAAGTGQAGGRRPQQEIIGGCARSSLPAVTLARCWAISSSVAMPCSKSSSLIRVIVAASR